MAIVMVSLRLVSVSPYDDQASDDELILFIWGRMEIPKGRQLRLECDKGKIAVLGKGGRVRTVLISKDLYSRLEAHFTHSKAPNLAPLRAYQVAVRRATLAVGGQSTGTHAHRRTSAEELKNAKYKDHLKDGKTTKKASEMAVQDAVEQREHSRYRKDLARAYLLL